MPRGDRTGPGGEGPKTGRAAGFCVGAETPGYMNPPAGGMGGGMGWGMRGGMGRGFRGFGGFRRGRGFRWGGGYGGYGFDTEAERYYQPAQSTDTQNLENQIAELKEQFQSLMNQVNEYFSKSPKKD